MDLDFRASTIHSANHLSTLQAARLHSVFMNPHWLFIFPFDVELILQLFLFLENYSVFDYTDEDDDAQSVFRCPFCDFEIEVSVLRSRLEEVHGYNPKVCPVCDENLGEDAIGVTQHLSSRKRTWKYEKSSVGSGNSAMLGKKLAARGSRHEPMPDPVLSPFICNVSVPNPSGIHPDEDSINNASDISNAESSGPDAPDMGDEQDHQERRLRASFVQELVFSTIF